jgi:hypothetical protein
MASQPKPRVIDRPEIREIYSDKMVGASFGGGSIILTLGCNRFAMQQADEQQANEGTIVVNNRIALSPQLALDLVNALTQLINAANNAAQQQAQTAAAAKIVTATPDPGQTKPQ